VPNTKTSAVYKKKKVKPAPQVSEPAVSFYPAPISRSLVLQRLSKPVDSRLLLKKLLEQTNLPVTFLAEHVFEISPKTLAGYRANKTPLPSRFTETCAELEQLYAKGKELFSSLNAFNQWMHQPAYGLGNRVPVSLLNSSAGISLLFDELIRIEHGALA
jgi:putative toxin-antitoxin system antitoxin component (TIGR02293 family)